MTNGLWEGCTPTPVLLNIYFSAVVTHWRLECPDVGVTVKHKPGRRLVDDRIAKSLLLPTRVTETPFADDAAVFSTTRQDFESSTTKFITCASQWGLTVSVAKTKGMAVNTRANAPMALDGGEAIDAVESFTYLGSAIQCDGLSSLDFQARIGKTSKAFGSLKQAVFENRSLSLQYCRRVYVAVVLSTLLYGAETWPTKAPDLRRLNLLHHQCVRTIVGVSQRQQWETHATSSALAKTLGVPEDIGHIIWERRLRWLGHVTWMEDHRLPKSVIFGELPCPAPGACSAQEVEGRRYGRLCID